MSTVRTRIPEKTAWRRSRQVHPVFFMHCRHHLSVSSLGCLLWCPPCPLLFRLPSPYFLIQALMEPILIGPAELGWARHLSINAVVLPPPKNPKQVARYAATVARAVHQPHSTMLWFRVPLAGSTESDDSSVSQRKHARGEGHVFCFPYITSHACSGPSRPWHVIASSCDPNIRWSPGCC